MILSIVTVSSSLRFFFQTLANGRKTAKECLPNFLAHPRRAPSLARFSFACSISAPPEKGKESAATQAMFPVIHSAMVVGGHISPGRMKIARRRSHGDRRRSHAAGYFWARQDWNDCRRLRPLQNEFRLRSKFYNTLP